MVFVFSHSSIYLFTNIMAPIFLLHSNSSAEFMADVYEQEGKDRPWMQEAHKTMQGQRFTHTPNTLMSSSIVTRKSL